MQRLDTTPPLPAAAGATRARPAPAGRKDNPDPDLANEAEMAAVYAQLMRRVRGTRLRTRSRVVLFLFAAFAIVLVPWMTLYVFAGIESWKDVFNVQPAGNHHASTSRPDLPVRKLSQHYVSPLIGTEGRGHGNCPSPLSFPPKGLTAQSSLGQRCPLEWQRLSPTRPVHGRIRRASCTTKVISKESVKCTMMGLEELLPSAISLSGLTNVNPRHGNLVQRLGEEEEVFESARSPLRSASFLFPSVLDFKLVEPNPTPGKTVSLESGVY
jgi:hypothetical protein